MKMRIMFGLLTLLIFSANSFGAGTSTGPVTFIQIHATNYVIFTAGPRQSNPSCHTASSLPNSWIFSLSTEAGRGMLSFLLAAKSMGKSINVYGTNTCTSELENAAWISIN